MLFKYTHTAQWEFPGLRPNLTPARKYLGGGRHPSTHTSHLAFSVTLATHNSISSFHKSHGEIYAFMHPHQCRLLESWMLYSIDATRPPSRQAEEAENGPKPWVTNPPTAYGDQRGVSDPTPGLGQKKKGMWCSFGGNLRCSGALGWVPSTQTSGGASDAAL